ncbi:GRM8, partial [Symbiodinium sp. CCMP2592]
MADYQGDPWWEEHWVKVWSKVPPRKPAKDGAASSPCAASESGFYSDELGLEACKKCPKGTDMVNTGASVCTPCGLNQETEAQQESGSQAATDCRCAEGMYMCNGVGCQTCPEGLYCAA